MEGQSGCQQMQTVPAQRADEQWGPGVYWREPHSASCGEPQYEKGCMFVYNRVTLLYGRS